MKLRILFLSLLAFLAACNDNSESPVSDSTFASDPMTAVSTAEPVSNPAPLVASYADIALRKHPVENKIAYDFTAEGALELAAVDETPSDLINVGLAGRIPVKSFEGGHMTYESEEARVPLKQELDKFYGASSVLALQ